MDTSNDDRIHRACAILQGSVAVQTEDFITISADGMFTINDAQYLLEIGFDIVANSDDLVLLKKLYK